MNKAQVKKQYDLTDVAEEFFGPVFVQSAFDTAAWPVVTSDKPSSLQMFDWGLIPFWVKSEDAAAKMRTSTVNARIETVGEKPAFRSVVGKNRCLVLADGFYEFRELNKSKYPYYIRMKDSEGFAMAGIFDTWANPGSGEIIKSFSVLTTDANPMMAKIHNRKLRMPVILNKDTWSAWLDHTSQPADFSRPFPEDRLEAWTVSRRLVSRTEERNVADACAPIAYPEIVLADHLNI